ncbi:MAG: glycosyltransferase family 2 protein [Microscillaceae bacterium]|jgi:glycosyltransferase involved in cell wall biosynthesis|nr:glycosyltransferase family 2 protein [Microscillaceae bacterium]
MAILFSIVIPTYNRAEFIQHTIESILKQTYQNFEIIVVDDGSTDHTAQVVQDIQSDKISYFYKTNGERGAARNFGILRAKGDYVTFLDSDDIIYPHHLAEALQLIQNEKSAAFLHLAYEVKDPQGRVLWQVQHRGNPNEQLLYGNHLSCIGVFVRRDIIQQNLFNEAREIAGTEDWELWLRLAARFPIKYSNAITSAIINHETRSVLNVDETKLTNRLYLALAALQKDEVFKQKYGKKIKVIYAHADLYIALHLILAKQKIRGIQYAVQALVNSPSVSFTYKFWVILYKFLFF